MPLARFPDAQSILNHLKNDSLLAHQLKEGAPFEKIKLAEKIGDVFQKQERDFPEKVSPDVYETMRKAGALSDMTMDNLWTIAITQSLGRLLASHVHVDPPSDVREEEEFIRGSLQPFQGGLYEPESAASK